MQHIDCGSGHHYGICPVCRRGHGYVLKSTTTMTRKQSAAILGQTTSLHARATKAKAELRDARDSVQYWTRQTALRTDPAAKAQAAGLALAWQTTVAAREAALADLDAQIAAITASTLTPA